jgi:hypothetical protein
VFAPGVGIKGQTKFVVANETPNHRIAKATFDWTEMVLEPGRPEEGPACNLLFDSSEFQNERRAFSGINMSSNPGLFTAATGARESPDPKTQFWPLAPFATA